MSKETLNKKIGKTRSAPKLLLAFGMVAVGLGLIVFGLRGLLEDTVYIKTPKMLIRAEIADNESERVRGLSGRNSLDGNRAMLFIFDEPGIHSIWMKDMKFAIDIVWLDEDKRVVAIEANIKPDSYPEKYNPPKPVKYAIEFPKGRAATLGIKINQILSW